MAQEDAAVLLTVIRQMLKDGTAERIRLASGLSKTEVAESIGTSAQSVGRWERLEAVPRGEVAERYAALLGRLDELVDS
jgi:DNA-binding transcriptional regulator YiaG